MWRLEVCSLLQNCVNQLTESNKEHMEVSTKQFVAWFAVFPTAADPAVFLTFLRVIVFGPVITKFTMSIRS